MNKLKLNPGKTKVILTKNTGSNTGGLSEEPWDCTGYITDTENKLMYLQKKCMFPALCSTEDGPLP